MLFFFKQFQIGPPNEEDKKAGKKQSIIKVVDCIDPDYVLRGRMYPDGNMIILLKDGHETTKAVDVQSKTGVKSTANQKVWVQTEINLSPEDAARLRNITEILDDGDEPYLGPVEEVLKTGTIDGYPVEGAFNGTERGEKEPEMGQIGPNDKY